jgi:hypothetical protein
VLTRSSVVLPSGGATLSNPSLIVSPGVWQGKSDVGRTNAPAEPDASKLSGSGCPAGPWHAHSIASPARADAGAARATTATASASSMRIPPKVAARPPLGPPAKGRS